MTGRILPALLVTLPLSGCVFLDAATEDEPTTCRSTGNGGVVRCDHEDPPREVRKPGDPHTLPDVRL